MSNVPSMAVGHGLEHLGRQITGIGLTVGLLFTNSIKEISTTHEFHDDEITISLIKEINQGCYVSMLQGSQNGNFVVDSCIIRWWEVLSQDTLDGNLLASGTVSSSADCGEGTRLELCITKRGEV
jgi:hypothetical protein